MRYPEAVNLPFNATVIEREFVRASSGMEIPDLAPVYAVLQGGGLVVDRSRNGFQLPMELPAEWMCADERSLFIGCWNGRPVLALRIGKEIPVQTPFFTEPFNATAELLDDTLLTIGGLAQQILHWEGISRLCGRCGGSTDWISGSWGKKCCKCGYERYPAVHPCAIVLVRRDNEFLLVRKPEWVSGRYGLVAGFLDFGESLEECAAREVLEETGIAVKDVCYVGSQCWPFPSQLMAGFIAEYAGGEIVMDKNELDDARWFTLGKLPDSLPPHRSIARWIIEKYLLNRDGVQG